jgi:WD40 repeat protein
LPATPYRGIQPFRYADHAIFFAREDETRQLARLVDVYRGVFLYGASGDGKSSLINAGLLPEVRRMGFAPVRVRVQPRAGEELVLEPIASSDDGDALPLVLAPVSESSERSVLSIAEFDERVRDSATLKLQPLLVFDQFEEILTLFVDGEARATREALAAMLVGLLRDAVAVKFLFAFREDYLGAVKQLLAGHPQLVDQALRLRPPSPDSLETIIRGPFARFPDHFEREFHDALTQQLVAALRERFAAGDVSLSEVQSVCLRLWRSSDPAALLTLKGVQGLLEDELGEALDGFPADVRAAAVALLSHMVTSGGTRNVVSAEDLRQRVRDEDEDVPVELVDEALDLLERESKLVRRERRRDLYLYEITSEFLVPWISRRREELRIAHERRRDRRRLRVVSAVATALLIVAALVAALAVWALRQRNEAVQEKAKATSLALASTATPLLGSRPDISLLLALEAYRVSPLADARGSVLTALVAARDPSVVAIMRGHADDVGGVAFEPGGRTLASVGEEGTVRIWDTRTHRQVGGPLARDANGAAGVRFSSDGSKLVYGSNTKLKIVDVASRKPVATLTGHKEYVYDVAVSADGRTLASAGGDDRTFRVWDARTFKPLGKPFAGFGFAVSVALSADGRTLAAADGGSVRLFDVRTHRALGPRLIDRRSTPGDVEFSPDGRTLAVGAFDGTIRLWRVGSATRKGRLLRGHKHDELVQGVAFSPDGRTLASAGWDSTVRLWSTRTGRQLGDALTGHANRVKGVAFSPDGRTLASGASDRTIRLWNVHARDKQPGAPLRARRMDVNVLAFSRDGRTLASAGFDNTIRLWNVLGHELSGRPLSGHRRGIHSVAFSPDGRTLASAGNGRFPGSGVDTSASDDEGTIRLWDARTHKPLGAMPGRTGTVFRVAFSRDGRQLASAGDRIRVWDVQRRKQLGAPVGTSSTAGSDLAFSPVEDVLATAGGDGAVRLWDLRTRRQLGKPLGTGDSIAFSPDGRVLAVTVGGNMIALWDVHSRKRMDPPLSGHEDAVAALAFTDDGRTLVSTARDTTVRLWDVATRRQLISLRRTSDAGNPNVAASPDGRTIAAGGYGQIQLWQNLLWRDVGDLQSRVCTLVGRGLSRAEWSQYAPGLSYRRSSCP